MKKVFKRIIRRLYYFVKHLINEDENFVNTEIQNGSYSANIKVGKNCAITPSAILICQENSTIEFEGNNYIGRNVEIGSSGKIFFGSHTSIQDRCIILGDVEIGRYCIFAPNIYLSSGRHYYNLRPTLYIKDQDAMVQNDTELFKKHSNKIVIEDDCWLGINVVVMSGITIGKGSVIGANSVVTRNVEPYSVMAGSPSILFKKRLNFELRESISFSNDSDLPYFYSGFYTDYLSLEKSRKTGGIKVMKTFSVRLKSEGKETIILQVKKKNSQPIQIKYNYQVKDIIASEFSNISFTIGNTDLHKFELLSTNENDFSENIIFIQSIKTQ